MPRMGYRIEPTDNDTTGHGRRGAPRPESDDTTGHGRYGKPRPELDDTVGHGRRGAPRPELDDTEGHGRRSPRRVAKGVVGALLVLAATFGTSAAASAETDYVPNQCIAVWGVQRGCMQGVNINWGSGISWTASGTVVDSRYDSFTVQVEVMLNRKWSSNTPWMRVGDTRDSPTYRQFPFRRSGYDPTYGAWVRLCTTSPSGVKYCLSPVYRTDNS